MASNKDNVELNNDDNQELSHEETRRNFMKKFGKLAAVTPLAVTALMSPKTSAAPKSCKPQQNNKHCKAEPASKNSF
ncbi:hypothetical protein [Thalassotalea crassostreae]|uniref:hypothetical protein n=1 Tax=Thalassotalea crassostreae TaxID=1763536 RepID=UPI0008386CAC|nr:hypothetical protein [Thalassotalea crassostreae]